MSVPHGSRLSEEDLFLYLQSAIFRLQAPEYGLKYPNWPGAVGLEVEMLPVFVPVDGNKPATVPLQGSRDSLAAYLRVLSQRMGWHPNETPSEDPSAPANTYLLKVDLEEQDNLSFEPGGQLEFSSRPYPCLSDAAQRLQSVQSTIQEELSGHGIQLVQLGINPWHSLDDIGLQMTKARYRAMNDYYQSISPYGRRMMRQTCTVQVNLDFGPSENVMVKRYVASQLLAPFATAIFACSAIVEGKSTGFKSFRSKIWRHTDPTHTGIVGLELLTKSPKVETCIQTYLDFALDANVIFVEQAGYYRPTQLTTFREWLKRPIAGQSPTLEDFKTHLSLLFPEVRPRGFLELRSVDCIPAVFQTVPASFLCSLLYDDKACDALLDLLLPHAERIEEYLNLAGLGLDSPVLTELSQKIMKLALDGNSRLTSCFKVPGGSHVFAKYAETYTLQGRVPADDILEVVTKEGAEGLTFASLMNLQERWLQNFSES